jgi:hypothetical protein
MTAAIKRGRIMNVSPRDREIYRLVDIERRPQRVVAAEVKLSQARVNVIVQRVRRWMQMPLPPKLDEGDRASRLQEHSRAHRMRLAHYLDEATLAWEASKKGQITVKKLHDREGKLVKEEWTAKASAGNQRFLETATKLSLALLSFDGMDKAGKVDLSAEGRLPELVELTKEEFVDEYSRFAKKVAPMVEEVRRRTGEGASGRDGEKLQPSEVNDELQISLSPTLPLSPSELAPDEKALSKALSPTISAETWGEQPVNEPLSEAIQPLSNVIEPVSEQAEPVSAMEKGSGVFGVQRPSITEGANTSNTPDPGGAAASAQETPPAAPVQREPIFDGRPAPRIDVESTLTPAEKRAKYAWLRPSMRVETEEERKRFRVTVTPPREYPPPTHYYDTRTGKRIEMDPAKRSR